MDLGRPIASAVLVQEYLIGLVFLRVCGWLFMILGGLILLGGVIAAIAAVSEPLRPRPRNDAFALIAVTIIGGAIGGAGAWFGYFRGRVINQMCWFCPHGMVWMTEKVFEWYAWAEVHEVYCKLCPARPAVGISMGGPIAWISFSNTATSRRIVPYFENRAAAANIEKALHAIAEGRTIRFGEWRVRKSAIQGIAEEIAWRNVFEIERNDRDLLIRHEEHSALTIPLDEIPFPSMFTALARALHAHARERPA